MAVASCAECKAIYEGMLDLVEMARQNKPGDDATPQELAAWFDQQDEDEAYKMRVRVALSKVKNRLIEHQKLTGHNVPRPTESAILCWWLPNCGLYPTGEGVFGAAGNWPLRVTVVG